jgi:phenylacetate-CoA ligase
MIYDPEVETRPVEAQYELDRAQYEKQVAYLLENSTFYQRKLAEAGFHSRGGCRRP